MTYCFVVGQVTRPERARNAPFIYWGAIPCQELFRVFAQETAFPFGDEHAFFLLCLLRVCLNSNCFTVSSGVNPGHTSGHASRGTHCAISRLLKETTRATSKTGRGETRSAACLAPSVTYAVCGHQQFAGRRFRLAGKPARARVPSARFSGAERAEKWCDFSFTEKRGYDKARTMIPNGTTSSQAKFVM